MTESPDQDQLLAPRQTDPGAISDPSASTAEQPGRMRWVRWLPLVLLIAALAVASIDVLQAGSLRGRLAVAGSGGQGTRTSLEEGQLPVISPAAPTTPALASLGLDEFPIPVTAPGPGEGIFRFADPHTEQPARPRISVLKYEVQKGDTLFGISERFGLKPETILWGNWYTMAGDPHTLRPGQKLSILPVDGVLHIWGPGEGINGVAKFYGVSAEAIIDWPGNNLELSLGLSQPTIPEGSEVVIPGGRREPPSWQTVRITRSNPSAAKVLGPGACSGVSGGSTGSGSFIWPTTSSSISGYGYTPGIHEAIDIGGATGVGISASDSGVVVYSGWNNWGYGVVVVLDHGNGWQTLYAHLSQSNVACGQSVSQGGSLGLMGCTGNCTGPHLHLEMRNDAYGRVNPLDFLP